MNLNHILKITSIMPLIFLLASCSENSSVEPSKGFKMAILTDLHVYDNSQGHTSDEFKESEFSEIKMFGLSEALLKQATIEINELNPEIVLVCGDLTKDGGIINHVKCREYLEEIELNGSKVFVIPGNHDISGNREVAYPDEGGRVPVNTMDKDGFAVFYAKYGYDEAISKDSNSLSYIVEPLDGVWIFGIDACNYDNRFDNLSWIDGELSGTTKDWIFDKLAEAHNKNKEVIGFIHHGIIEHFPFQEAVFDEYLITDWKATAEKLAAAGMNFIFTGHNHASDISKLTDNSSGTTIYDIQTNATVSWNSTWRECRFDYINRTFSTEGHPISEIDYDLPNNDFISYSSIFNEKATSHAARSMMKNRGIADTTIELILPLVTSTLSAYREGDEPQKMTPYLKTQLDKINAFAQNSNDGNLKLFVVAINLIWSDDTQDNHTTIQF
jgi:3',5'-cyclic AMP phosphodiesterase CpdA